MKDEIDVTGPLATYEIAVNELKDERYELALERIDQAYEEIIELKGFVLKANAMYAAASKNLLSFISENRYVLGLLIGLPVLFYLIFRKKLKADRLNARLAKFSLERDVLEKEIKKAQERYFVKKELSESNYQTKVRVYAEMIRDLNKKISVVEESLEKLRLGKALKEQSKQFLKKSEGKEEIIEEKSVVLKKDIKTIVSTDETKKIASKPQSVLKKKSKKRKK